MDTLTQQLIDALRSIADQAQNAADHLFFGDPHSMRNEMRLIAEKARRASLGVLPEQTVNA